MLAWQKEHPCIETLPIDNDTQDMLKDYIEGGGPTYCVTNKASGNL
jgi:hypothetical protein